MSACRLTVRRASKVTAMAIDRPSRGTRPWAMAQWREHGTMFESARARLGAGNRNGLDQLLVDARTGPGSRMFSKQPRWFLILLTFVIGPVVVVGVLLAGLGQLDDRLRLPSSSIPGAVLAVVAGSAVGGLFALRHRGRRSDDRR